MATARPRDDTPDPRLNDFVEILAQALVLDYQKCQLAAEKKQPEPAEEQVK